MSPLSEADQNEINKEDDLGDEVPDEFICPLTKELSE